ncbi:inositol monophosphatase [Methylocella sp.]|uniref:inositol monophosphatase family protein n=1 Tax=Methylocella sp. TaxID=1978226 RepID=UPI0035B10F38
MIRSALMTVMTAAAIKAGRGLKRDFGEVENLQVSVKGPGDFVSAADKKAEKVIFEELSRARPGYGFLMEESGEVEGSDKSHTWIIDPLDGTTNFLHGLPLFSISIGLVREGQIVAGLVYNPATEDMYVAEKGQGAYHNNRRLRVAARRDVSEALIGCGVPHIGKSAEHARFIEEFSTVMRAAGAIRRLGSAALDLCHVAEGSYDGFWERGLKAWDVAAGIVMIREAGGFVTDADGAADPLSTCSVCAGNDSIHRALLALLKKSRPAAPARQD